LNIQLLVLIQRRNKMPILKEWTCTECNHEFEGYTDICDECGGAGKRSFRTAFHYSRGYAKKTDAIIANQFEKKGITNYFSNANGNPKITWKQKPYKGPGRADSGGQPAVAPMFGADALSKIGFQPNGLVQTVAPDLRNNFKLPDTNALYAPIGRAIGGKPDQLLNNTNTIGGLDIRGRQIVRVK
jgi:hypothetical protein